MNTPSKIVSEQPPHNHSLNINSTIYSSCPRKTSLASISYSMPKCSESCTTPRTGCGLLSLQFPQVAEQWWHSWASVAMKGNTGQGIHSWRLSLPLCSCHDQQRAGNFFKTWVKSLWYVQWMSSQLLARKGRTTAHHSQDTGGHNALLLRCQTEKVAVSMWVPILYIRNTHSRPTSQRPLPVGLWLAGRLSYAIPSGKGLSGPFLQVQLKENTEKERQTCLDRLAEPGPWS